MRCRVLARAQAPRRRASRAGVALAYLLYPATQWLTLSEFHPVALACPLLLYAYWFLDEDRLVPFAVFAVLAAMTKEEVPLVIAGLGAWYAITRKRWATGAASLRSALWTAIAVGIVIPHYSDGSEPGFYGRYEEVGGSATGSSKRSSPIR